MFQKKTKFQKGATMNSKKKTLPCDRVFKVLTVDATKQTGPPDLGSFL